VYIYYKLDGFLRNVSVRCTSGYKQGCFVTGVLNTAAAAHW